MKFRRLLVTTTTAALLLLWSGGIAQQAPNPGTQAESSTTSSPLTGTRKSKTKAKHWSGNLVDVSCMVKTLSNGDPSGAGATDSEPPGVPHFAPTGYEPALQTGQQGGAGQTGPGGSGEQNPSTPPAYPTTAPSEPGPGMSPEAQAQQERANRVDQAAKKCPATPTTQTFGLAMSGGQIMQFDPAGNGKAAEALKGVSVQPGKKIKAKVSGTMESATMVNVASVEVKGGKRSASSATSSSGS